MEPLSLATREIMWNISTAWIMYVLFLLALAVSGYGTCQRIQFWKKGKAENERLSDLLKRFLFVIREVLLQNKVRRAPFPALFHSLFFYSFLILILTTGIIALDYDFGTSLFTGWLYVFLSIASELAGVLIFFGVLMALWRRYVRKPTTLETTLSDLWALVLLALIVITGFLAEGIRMSVAGDNWPGISFVGLGVSVLFAGIEADSGTSLHAVLWWIHMIIAFVWIATIPYTKFFHVITLCRPMPSSLR